MTKQKEVIRAWIAPDFFGLFYSGIVQNNELKLIGVAETSNQAKDYLDSWASQKELIVGVLCEFTSINECANKMLV